MCSGRYIGKMFCKLHLFEVVVQAATVLFMMANVVWLVEITNAWLLNQDSM